jgi:hypothetical protein
VFKLQIKAVQNLLPVGNLSRFNPPVFLFNKRTGAWSILSRKGLKGIKKSLADSRIRHTFAAPIESSFFEWTWEFCQQMTGRYHQKKQTYG